MRLRICTWNVNSVRLRVEHAARFVAEQAPDVLCLQEIKCREGEFPKQAFIDMGLPHLKIAGQKGWHGVAIASRLPIEDPKPLDVCREGRNRYPEDNDLLRGEAMMRLSLGDKAAGEACLVELLRRDPNNAHARFHLARLRPAQTFQYNIGP